MVNWVYVRAMLTLIILRELHTKSVDFFLDYTQADVKLEISMELPIMFLHRLVIKLKNNNKMSSNCNIMVTFSVRQLYFKISIK